MSLNLWLLACAVMIALDFAWTKYTLTTAAKRIIPAGSWSVMITLFSAINTLVIVENWWYVTATATGAFIGTALGVWLEKHKDGREKIARELELSLDKLEEIKDVFPQLGPGSIPTIPCGPDTRHNSDCSSCAKFK